MKVLDWWSEFFLLVIYNLSELIIKCVTVFGMFCENLKRTNGNAIKHHYFNVHQNKVVCRPQDMVFRSNGVDGFGGLNFLFFIVILSELIVNVDLVLTHYLCTLLALPTTARILCLVSL